MANLSYNDFVKKIVVHSNQKIYFIFGEEIFLVDDVVKKIKKNVLKEGTEDFNLNVFFGQEASAEVVIEALSQFPIMSNQRLVILREFQDLKAKDQEALSVYFDQFLETSVLVIVSSRVDKRKKIFKKLSQIGLCIECKPPPVHQIASWINYLGKQQGLQLSDLIVKQIQWKVGSCLLELNNELKKLSQFLGNKNQPTTEDVNQVISESRIENIFNLSEAIGKGDRNLALILLSNLLDNGQNEVAALALVTRHIRILLIIKSGLRFGFGKQELCSKIGIPQFYYNDYYNQTKLWSEKKLKDTMQKLVKTDKALKSSSLSSQIWLENFIFQTCSSGTR